MTKANLKNAAGVTEKWNLLHKYTSGWLQCLKSEIDKWDIDKLEKTPTVLSSLKSKVDKLDVDKLVLTLVDLSKQSDEVKMMSLKRLIMMNWL